MSSGAAIAVNDSDGEHGGDFFTLGDEVEVGLTDVVGPVDGAVVAVAFSGGEGEGSFDRGLLRIAQHQCGCAIGTQGAHRLGEFRCGRAIA